MNLPCARTAFRRIACAALLAVATLAAGNAARAEGDPWTARYEAARTDMIEGRLLRAESEFLALSRAAKGESQRLLALEMARLSGSYAARAEREELVRRGALRVRPVRGKDELTLLYGSAFVYGAGTGAWFLLQTQPDSALTATLPFAALTAAPVIAVATVDSVAKLPRGVPHALSAGLGLGVGEAVWLVGFQHARANRFERVDPNSDARWDPEMTATVLWGSATLGVALGGALGSSLETTPGRVSFTTSTTIWAGVLSGLTAGALLPDDAVRQERAFLLGGLGYNAGLAGGLLTAGRVSPSVARVRLVDLLGIGGMLLTTGMYLSAASRTDVRAAEGLAALGGGAGLVTGWLVTSAMPAESVSSSPRSPSSFAFRPTLSPVPSGLTLGISGSM